MCPSLIEIGSKTAEKISAQTNRQTNRHYENNMVTWPWTKIISSRVKLPVSLQEIGYPLYSYSSRSSDKREHCLFDKSPLITAWHYNIYLALKILIKFCSPLWRAWCQQKRRYHVIVCVLAEESIQHVWIGLVFNNGQRRKALLQSAARTNSDIYGTDALYYHYIFRFLANVNSPSRSLYAVGRPSSVCRL